MGNCLIDNIVKKQENAFIVFEDKHFIAFLDSHPVFHGHILLAPKDHYQTLYDVPSDLVSELFLLTQRLGLAVEKAMDAQGSFIAINNTVSQSIPHLHIHIIPRNRKDGLKGFFWPRTHYDNEIQMINVQTLIKNELDNIL